MKIKPQLFISIIMLTTLTGCANNNNISSENSSVADSTTVANPSSSVTSDNTESTESESNIHQMRLELFGEGSEGKIVDITDETEWVLRDFMGDRTLYYPDGTLLNPSEAKKAFGTELGASQLYFDFAYIRNAEPYYYTNLDNPEIYNQETDDIADDIYYNDYTSESIDNATNFYRIKAGDVIDNGLKVKLAVSCHSYCNETTPLTSIIEFEGELSASGMLINSDGGLLFIPDPSSVMLPKTAKGLLIYSRHEYNIAVVADSGIYGIENNDVSSAALNELFTESNAINAKVTLKNPIFKYADDVDFYNAELVSYEIVE